jgi:hypothetical protein
MKPSELAAAMDERLIGRAIMVTMDRTVLVMDHGNWYGLNEDFTLTIALAPFSVGEAPPSPR